MEYFQKLSMNLKIWLWWISPMVGGLSKNVSRIFGAINFFLLMSPSLTSKLSLSYSYIGLGYLYWK